MAEHNGRVFICDLSGSIAILRTPKIGGRAAIWLPALFGLFLAAEYGVFKLLGDPRLVLYSGAAVSPLLTFVLLGKVLRRHEQIHPPGEPLSLTLRVVRALRGLAERKTLTDIMLRRSVDIFLPFCSVACLFFFLQIWLDIGVAKPAAERTVQWLEQTAIWLRSVNPLTHYLLKIPKWIEFFFVFALAVLSLSVPSMLKIGRWWKMGSRWLGRAYILITLIASVTFLGNQQGQAIKATVAKLNQQREAIRQAYADAADAIEKTLVVAAAEEIRSSSPLLRHWDEAEHSIRAAERDESTTRVYNTQKADDLATEIRNLGTSFRAPQTGPGPARPATASARTGQPPEQGERGPSESARSDRARAAFSAGEDAHWTTAQAEDIRQQAENARFERKAQPAETWPKPNSKPFHLTIEKFADALYNQLSSRTIKQAFVAAGLEDELWQFAVDPLLHTPAKEFLKTRLKALVDDVITRKATIAEAKSKFRADVQARLGASRTTFDSPRATLLARVEEYKARASKLRTRAADTYARVMQTRRVPGVPSSSELPELPRGFPWSSTMMTLESFSSELNLSAKLVPDEESRGTRANVVEVFGRVKCERTNQARDLFRKAGATVRFYNVDKNKPAAAIVNENVWWLVHGELPFIRVDGRPIRATTESCSRALQKM